MMTALIPRRYRRSAVPALRDVRSLDLDRIFDDLWSGFGTWPAEAPMARFTPRVDVRADEDAIVVSAELPGLEEKDFDISLEDEVLTIKGEKRSEREEEREGYRHSESTSGSFERRFALPAGIDVDKVEATFKNGVVTVTLPKTPEAKPEVRTIPVTTG